MSEHGTNEKQQKAGAALNIFPYCLPLKKRTVVTMTKARHSFLP